MTSPPENLSATVPTQGIRARLRARLESLRREDRLRGLPSPGAPTGAIDLRTNDTLGLSTHPRMIEAVKTAAERFGVGAGASRLIAERHEIVRETEARFAEFKRAERALMTPTGFAANTALLGALADERTLILLDKRSHASLIDGALLASTAVSGGARMRTYTHNDTDRARAIAHRHIRRVDNPLVLLVTESVFSMDGDCAPIGELADLRDEINEQGHADCALILDEAHATGVLGKTGAGGDELHGRRADVTVSTASKALGAMGGVIAGPAEVIEAVVNTGRSFIYSTGAMPIQAAAVGEALSIIRDEPQRRERLRTIIEHVRAQLAPLGVRPFETDPTPIVPIVLGETERTRRAHERLASEEILTSLIRPPTVPTGSSRLRMTLHAELSDAEVERLCASVRGVASELAR